MATAKDRQADYNAAYTQAYSSFGPWQDSVRSDIRAYLGDSYTSKEKLRLRQQDRDPMNIQMIRRIVNWISGYQRDRRLGIQYEPTEFGDDRTASQLNKLIAFVMARSNGYETISDGFEHALKSGMSLINVFGDADNNAQLGMFYYNQFLLDPAFTRVDLRDCQYGIIRKYVSKDAAKILLPQSKHGLINKIDDTKPSTDEKFPNYRHPTIFNKQLLAYDEFQQRTTKNQFIVIVKPTGQEIEWNSSKRELGEVLPIILQQNNLPAEAIRVVRRTKMTVDVSAFLNGKLVNSGMNLFGLDDFSFTPIIAYYSPEYEDMRLKLQGIVRCLVDPQRAENKRILAMISWFEQQIGGGLDFEEGALVDEEDAWKTGPGKPRMFKEDAIAQNRFRDRVTPAMPGGMLEIHQILDTAMPKMVGITEEMFGTQRQDTNAEISGVLAKLRLGAGMVGLRGLFDNLSMSQRVIGGKMLKLIQQYSLERVKRIIRQDPTPEFFSRNFGKYDAVTSEGMLTDTQRDLFYAELVNLKRLGIELQDPAPITWSQMLAFAPVQMKDTLMVAVKQAEAEKKQKQQAAQKRNDMLENIAIQSAMAQINENQAQARERSSQNVENIANSQLSRAKTATEIESLGDKSTLELLKIAANLEGKRIAAEAKGVQNGPR